jgi:hypothetical protein
MPNEPISRDVKLGFLKDEYLLLQKSYEDFDTKIMTIKGWSATVGIAAIGGGFYYSRFLWLFAAGVCLIFWVLEALWKSFQYNYAPRIILLEEAFRTGDVDDIAPFQVYGAWYEAFQSAGYIQTMLAEMRLFLVFFPHVVPCLAGPILFLLDLKLQLAKGW